MSNPLEEAINCGDGEQAAGLRAMRPNLSIDSLFPITDEVSAMLMAVKAEHLYAANISTTTIGLKSSPELPPSVRSDQPKRPVLPLPRVSTQPPPLPAAVVRRGDGVVLHREGQCRQKAYVYFENEP